LCGIIKAAYDSYVENLKFSRLQEFTEILDPSITDFKEFFHVGNYLENTY
jgi:hypothetical protein